MPDSQKALPTATVITVMLIIVMQAPNQDSFWERGGHAVCRAAGNPSLPLAARSVMAWEDTPRVSGGRYHQRQLNARAS